MGTPAWAVHAIQTARSDAIRRSGAPVQVRCCGAAGVGLFATAPIATGEVILEERPLAAVWEVCGLRMRRLRAIARREVGC